MNHFYCVLSPNACAEYSQFQCDWRSTNDPCPFPIHLRCSFCVWNTTNYSPVGAMLFQSLAKLWGVIWGTLPGTLGGKWSPRPTPTNPSGRCHIGERAVFSYYYFYLPPVAQKMNHTCQSLSLVQGGHVCLYWSAAYVAQLLPAETGAGRGLFTLSLGNGTVGRQDSKQYTLD